MFFEPIYIPRTLNTGTCIQQGDLFNILRAHTGTVLAITNAGKKSGEVMEKMQVNGLEG